MRLTWVCALAGCLDLAGFDALSEVAGRMDEVAGRIDAVRGSCASASRGDRSLASATIAGGLVVGWLVSNTTAAGHFRLE
jgi:hypothetical protein